MLLISLRLSMHNCLCEHSFNLSNSDIANTLISVRSIYHKVIQVTVTLFLLKMVLNQNCFLPSVLIYTCI